MLNAKRFALLLVLLACAFAGLAALPPAFTQKGNYELYKTLHSKALDNLGKLDRIHRKEYRRLLADQDDILMAYLLAYESDANLQIARPNDLLSNYLHIRSLLNTRGTNLDPEFYLSYVAKQTVSDERIEAYREALLKDGLRDIMNSSADELDLYRKVSQWCVGRLKFQPTSGRDQSPLDITQKSLLGRCEEMQILFVAAARTVGLPARPASTPWWPHQDNNHAWAEVWLDGAWHYTGDMDAAYWPDQTWFSGLIDKTVLILADGSLPADGDEVLVRGQYDCVINSIRNYAGDRTRSLTIQTLDEQGNALPNTAVGVMVVNWGALRPLIWLKTDAEGKFTLSVGRGAFYLATEQDGKRALELVPSGDSTLVSCDLTLKAGPLADRDDRLIYPSNTFEWKQAPDDWNEGVKREKERWNAVDQSWARIAATRADSLSADFVRAARGNYAEAVEFLRRYPQPYEWFIQDCLAEEWGIMDPKFLWQASADQIEAVYHAYLYFELEDFGTSDLAALVFPNVRYEELPQPVDFQDGIPSFYPRSFLQKGYTKLERLNRAARWLKRNYKLNPDKALSGLTPLHVTLGRKYLNNAQYKQMAVNLARANGIPAAYTYRANLINVVYDNGESGYYDLEACAPETDPDEQEAFMNLKVLVSDESGAPLGSNERAVLILSDLREGDYAWLEGYSGEDKGNGVHSFRAPKGEFYLSASYRISDSQTAFQTRHLDLSQADSLTVEIFLKDYPRGWNNGVYYLITDLLTEADTTGCGIFLIGNHDQENSVRLAEKLRSLGQKFLWVGYEPAPQPMENYVVSDLWAQWVAEDQRNRVRTITLTLKNGKWDSYEGIWDHLPE
ncbi:MAG: transglutaminase-like domain-containing protein [Candidatus Cloacimonetes bacterium]|nr:transglutaminase-like domain-containing protein [Candidatus Cloacimonadota bacterium]MDY0367802.1 transglutaminase-like domain-containing protein [Candidatus Syntrophosphaera sp.]